MIEEATPTLWEHVFDEENDIGVGALPDGDDGGIAHVHIIQQKGKN